MNGATHPENHTEARFAIHGWRRYRGWAIVSIGIGAFLAFWTNRPAADATPGTSEHYYEVESAAPCECEVDTLIDSRGEPYTYKVPVDTNGTGYVPVKLYRRYLDESGRPSPAAMHESSWHIIQRDIPMLS